KPPSSRNITAIDSYSSFERVELEGRDMHRRSIGVLAMAAVLAAVAGAQDARSALQAAAAAMGATNLKTIQYSGAGWDSAVGQSYNLTSDWPRVDVSSYLRVIDYDAKTSREERTRRQGNN